MKKAANMVENEIAGIDNEKLNDNFPVAGVEIHLRYLGLFGDDVLNHVLGSVHVHHGINGCSQDNFSLDSPRDFTDQTVLTREGLHFRSDDGNVSCLKVNLVLNVPRDNFGNLVFQFSVGHLHDVHLMLPQSTWTTAHPRVQGGEAAGIGASLQKFGNLVLRDLLVARTGRDDGQIHAVSGGRITLS